MDDAGRKKGAGKDDFVAMPTPSSVPCGPMDASAFAR